MREKIKFNQGWLFAYGEDKVEYPVEHRYAYMSAKTERRRSGPASREYDYTGWRELNLPHDYVVEGEFNSAKSSSLGYLEYKNAWYIKKFNLPKSDDGRRITIYFEGVATEATVYLNGCLVKRSFTGYTPFEVDITDVVQYGSENVLAVFVNTNNHESWWYEGAGIYRDVWLVKTDLLAVDLYGLFVKPVYEDGKWRVDLSVTLRNEYCDARSATVKCDFSDGDGKEYFAEMNALVQGKDTATVNSSVPVCNPTLWSPEAPHFYKARARVVLDGEVVDETAVRFGFRTVEVDAQEGLFINGKHYYVNGVCGHADCGLTGKSVPDNVHRYKVKLLKEMGVNAYRCSHYPQADAMMDALDEAGFIVMAEARWFDSSDEGIRQMETLIKRDRNHPAVMFWSVGNEEPFHSYDQGVKIIKAMYTRLKKLDDSRFVTTAVDDPFTSTVFGECDVIGINYNLNGYEQTHEKYPGKAIFATECAAANTTRGYYGETNAELGLESAYDHDMDDYFLSKEHTWQFFAEHPWVMGGYQWIGIDHRGEAKWPAVSSKSGSIDLYLQKKDAFYQNRSLFTTDPMVHLLPHWNWNEGDKVKVWAYTNVPEVELFVNGKSLGKRTVQKFGHAEWLVDFVPGKIEARAYQGNEVVATDVKITTGAPVGLKLVQETTDVSANGEDMAIFTCLAVDADGNEVPNAEIDAVKFGTTGDCAVYSTGSDIRDHESLFDSTRRMWAGRISVAVLLGKEGGALTLTASADGFKSDTVTIKLK